MNGCYFKNGDAVELKAVPVFSLSDFQNRIRENLSAGKKMLSLFGAEIEARLELIFIMADYQTHEIEAGRCAAPSEYESLSNEWPQLERFEREIYEQFGVIPAGHPWLKPVRYDQNRFNPDSGIEDYPFYGLQGGQVHEVAVGPVHAGVIEPGHFRFQCHGERVYFLEIQLGYQHRGVETLLTRTPLTKGWAIAESICGDSVIAYSTAYAMVLEALTGTKVSETANWNRAIALELERMAMHLADLGGIATDIAYLPGNAAFGRIRTAIINQTLRICGSRFGHWWIAPGGVQKMIDYALIKDIQAKLRQVKKDTQIIRDLIMENPSVLARLESTGRVIPETAQMLGLTGFIGRTNGIDEDVRRDLPYGWYLTMQPETPVLTEGDCWARTELRLLEIGASILYLEKLLANYPGDRESLKPLSERIKPDCLAVAVVEGWRGGVVQIVLTGPRGETTRYKIKDPSFHNWSSLAMALRENVISDFPVCNKSHNLSYCGHDL
jgi:Ni,Fe-hydrogenase III large subunit